MIILYIVKYTIVNDLMENYMEQKSQIGNEYGSIMWDIEKLLNDIHKFKKRTFNVKNLALDNPFHGNEEYATTTDTTKPLIIVNLSKDLDKLIDGNHRLQKAMKLGIEKIEAYYLLFEEHSQYIVDFNENILINSS